MSVPFTKYQGGIVVYDPLLGKGKTGKQTLRRIPSAGYLYSSVHKIRWLTRRDGGGEAGRIQEEFNTNVTTFMVGDLCSIPRRLVI